MTWQSGGGGGIPGVTPDGLTPPGITVAGDFNFGDASAADVASFGAWYGGVQWLDTPAHVKQNTDMLTLEQINAITLDGQNGRCVLLVRAGDISIQDYITPVAELQDNTASELPVLKLTKPTGNGPALLVAGKLATNDQTTHALGAFSGVTIPIYDDSNNLIGYIPIYA